MDTDRFDSCRIGAELWVVVNARKPRAHLPFFEFK